MSSNNDYLYYDGSLRRTTVLYSCCKVQRLTVAYCTRIGSDPYTNGLTAQIVGLIYEYQRKHASIAYCKIQLQRNSIELHL
ncbi:hypothetical protein HBI71_245510 [Parastagonospora nodorum]|nr:hypothetical protein HBI71_245510 [Parastagonospora nodorum]